MTTQETPAVKKKAASKPKAPILLAERSISKQIDAIAESKLPDGVKVQVVDWLTGIKRALQLFEQVVDADNPPAPDSAHGKLIALGRSQRTLAQILAGVVGESDDEDEDEDPEECKPLLGDAKASGAALTARQLSRTPASIGV